MFDDVATIELRAIAGATLPLVDPVYTPDAAAGGRAVHGTDLGPGRPDRHGDRELPRPTSRTSGVPYSGFTALTQAGSTVETATVIERQPPPSGEGTVVLDIGGDRGER